MKRSVLLARIAAGIVFDLVGQPPLAYYDQAYTFTLKVLGGSGIVTFVRSGTLPTGIVYSVNADGSSVTFSGSSTDLGTFPILISAYDTAGNAASINFNIVVPELTLKLAVSSPLSFGDSLAVDQFRLVGQGGTGIYTGFTESGELAGAGLTLDTSTGEISGSPTLAGFISFVGTVTDSDSETFSDTFEFIINSNLTYIGNIGDPIRTGSSSGFSIELFGNTGSVTWTAPYTGTVPSGADTSTFTPVGLNDSELDCSFGIDFSSTPQTYSFTVLATDTGSGDSIIIPVTFDTYNTVFFTGSDFDIPGAPIAYSDAGVITKAAIAGAPFHLDMSITGAGPFKITGGYKDMSTPGSGYIDMADIGLAQDGPTSIGGTLLADSWTRTDAFNFMGSLRIIVEDKYGNVMLQDAPHGIVTDFDFFISAVNSSVTDSSGLVIVSQFSNLEFPNAVATVTNGGDTLTLTMTGVTAINATLPLTWNAGTQTLAIPVATTGVDGYLSHTDWGTFNAKAPTASPTFTGVPLAPTAATATNTTQIATTAFVQANTALKANIASPTFTGTPAAPTATAGTNTTQLATTSFVATSFAPLASPALSGTPTAPTATAGTNTTQLATTAFATTALNLKANLASPTFTGVPLAPTPAPGTNTTQLATTAYVVASYAPLASPAMTGVPTAPTATVGTNTTQLATTAFVIANAGGSGKAFLGGSQITVAAGDTIANNAAATDFATTITLAALSTFNPGTIIRVKAGGVMSSNSAPPSFGIGIKLGGTLLLPGITAPFAIVGATNIGWQLLADIKIISSTSVELHGLFSFQSTTTGSAQNIFIAATGPTTVSGSTISINAKWSVAAVADTITMRQFFAEVLPA